MAGRRQIVRTLTVVLLGALALTATPTLVTLAGSDDAACRVRNVNQDTHGRSFRRMVAAAHRGDLLRVRGTCSGGVTIRQDLRIRGEGDVPTLTGRGRYRVILVGRDAVVKLRDLTITHGVGAVKASDDSGGVYNRGVVTMIDVTVTGNAADFFAGGIYNAGDMTIRGSRVSDNTVWSEEGGGIYNTGYMTMTDTRVTGNTSGWGGGGITNQGELHVTDSTVARNTSDIGGGVLNWGTMVLTRSVVRDNRAGVYGYINDGGGIANMGTLRLNGSTVSGNVTRSIEESPGTAGGIYNNSNLALVDSVVTTNRAHTAGGIGNYQGTVVLTRSVVRENHARTNGGGIVNQGYVNDVAIVWLRDSRIRANTAGKWGGGIWNDPTWADVLVRGSSSVSGNEPDDCVGTAAC
jgi:hypothetical protein